MAAQCLNDPTIRSAIEAMRAVENLYGKQSWHPIGTTTFEGRPLKAQPVS